MLKDFGLTDNEARAYVALIGGGLQSPAEIAPRAGVTRGRVYQVLGELSRKGLAVEMPGRPRLFKAVDPRVALEAVMEERHRDMQRAVESLTASWERLQNGEPHSIPAIELLARPDQIALHFGKLQDEAEREILVFNKPPYAATGLDKVNQGELDALERGLRYAALYEHSIQEDPAWVADVRIYAEAGEEPRIVQELPMKLAIFDRKRALMPLATSHDPTQQFTSVVVHDAGLAATLAVAFDKLWEQADAFQLDRMGTDSASVSTKSAG